MKAGYSWYVYNGKKKMEFTNHHPDYDLDFSKGDIFRAHGYFVEHDDSLDVKFKLTPAELRTLFASSIVITPNDQLFPRFLRGHVGTRADVENYFNHYNKLFFDNKLPVPEFNIGKQKRSLGYANRRGITLSKQALQGPVLFGNVLIHEMIHWWQFNHIADNPNGVTEKFAKEMHAGGHGTTFSTHMKRLNALGFNVTVIHEGASDIEFVYGESYLLRIRATKNGVTGNIYFVDEKPFDAQSAVRKILLRYETLSDVTWTYGLHKRSLSTLPVNRFVRGEPSTNELIETKVDIMPDEVLARGTKEDVGGGVFTEDFEMYARTNMSGRLSLDFEAAVSSLLRVYEKSEKRTYTGAIPSNFAELKRTYPKLGKLLHKLYETPGKRTIKMHIEQIVDTLFITDLKNYSDPERVRWLAGFYKKVWIDRVRPDDYLDYAYDGMKLRTPKDDVLDEILSYAFNS